MPDAPMGSDTDELDTSINEVPAVVAIMVTHDAGAWFEDSLASLAAQDYPNMSVLVIDAGSTIEALPRVAEVMPSAYVRRLEGNPGFGAATNEVLSMVEGAPFLLLCHDDARFEPNVVRLLVEEAYRSNAGILGPKLVSWGASEKLLQVGLSVDKTGVISTNVDRGELDQEQHDAVRDVFVVPSTCMLVRADLFHLLGGFDQAINFLGEDLDLCWRAHVAGARVMVVPDARVEHQEALASRRPFDDRRRLQARHRLRTMLTVYTLGHLLRVLPQAIVFTGAEMLYALISGHPSHAVDVSGAWWWNLRRWRELGRRRRQIQSTRAVGDHEIRRLQIRGSARLLGFMRGELGRANPARALEEARQELADLQESLADKRSRVVPITIAATALVVLVAFRGVLRSTWAELGSIAGFDDGPMSLLGDYLRGWHAVGFDGQSPAPTASALVGIAGLCFLGAMGVLQHLLVLGTIPLGLVGIWKASSSFNSRNSRLVALVVYSAIPLAFNAYAQGRWAGLLMYATAPWMMTSVLRSTGASPWVQVAMAESGHRATRNPPKHSILGLGLVLGIVGSFVPMVILLFIAMSVVVIGFGLIGGPPERTTRRGVSRSSSPIRLIVGASAIAIVANGPWLVSMIIAGVTWESFAGIAPLGPGDASIADLLVFGAGPNHSFFTLGLPVGAALAILIAKHSRFRAAVQMWGLLLSSCALALVGQHDWLPVPMPGPEILLSFGAVGLALACGLSVSTFEQDLPSERFGWRQGASLLAGIGVVIGVLPTLVGALDGRANTPTVGLDRTLSFLDDESDGEEYRVAWIGDSEVLPMAGRMVAGDVALGVSDGGYPKFVDHWQMPVSQTNDDIERAIQLAMDGRSDHLGKALARYGIRYVILVQQLAPHRAKTPVHALPKELNRSIARQIDLRPIEIDPALSFYENAVWKSSASPNSTQRIEWWFIVAVLQLFAWVVAAGVVIRDRRLAGQEVANG